MLIVLLAGLLVVPAAVGLVYADARRAARPATVRRRWSTGVALLAAAGFVVPHVFERTVTLTYLTTVKSAPVVTTPLEILALHLALGVAGSAFGVLLYVTKTRFRPVPA